MLSTIMAKTVLQIMPGWIIANMAYMEQRWECKRRTFWSVYVSDSVPLLFDLNPSYLADIPTAVQWLLLSPLIDVVQ